MLRKARLSEADWLAMLPATGPMARSVLAGREDLPTAVRRALAAMGSGSVALPQPDGLAESDQPAADVDTIPSQISELVRRIDKFQSTRSQQPAIRRAPRDSSPFETGTDGATCSVASVRSTEGE